MSEPMSLSWTGQEDGGVPATVVRLGDGRLGFVAPDPPLDGRSVVLTVGDRSERGRATLVRSGPAYEEVRARLRTAAGPLERWRLRRDRPVLLVDPLEPEPVSDPAGPGSSRPS